MWVLQCVSVMSNLLGLWKSPKLADKTMYSWSCIGRSFRFEWSSWHLKGLWGCTEVLFLCMDEDLLLFKLEQNLNGFHGITGGRFLDFLHSWMLSTYSEYKCSCLQIFVVLGRIWMVYQTLGKGSRKLKPNLGEKGFYSIFNYPSLCGQVQPGPLYTACVPLGQARKNSSSEDRYQC